MTRLKEDGKTVIVERVRISYPHLFTPRAGPNGGEPKFSASFILEEGHDLQPLQQAIIKAGKEEFGGRFKEMLQKGQLKMPIRSDWESKGYPENSRFFSARSKHKPGVVDRYADADGNPVEITDPSKIYPGCVVNVSVRAYGYQNVTKGVGFALNNIQFVGDGERLDGRMRAADEFEPLEDMTSGWDGGDDDDDGSLDDAMEGLGGLLG